MTARQPLLDAIRRARGELADGFGYVAMVCPADLELLVDAAVQSLADADDARATLAVRPVVDDDGTVTEVTAVVPEAPR